MDFDARADGSKVAYRTVRAGRRILEHRGIQPQHAARHRVFGVAVFELDRLRHDARGSRRGTPASTAAGSRP